MTGIAYLSDTDWAIHHMKRVPRVTSRLQELLPLGAALSLVSLAEPWEGVRFSRDPAQSRILLDEFLEAVTLVPIAERVCERFGSLRGTLRQRGALPGDIDLFIAATALEYNLRLLSNNRKHFSSVTPFYLRRRESETYSTNV